MLIYFSLLVLLHVFLLINTKFTLWPEMVIYPYLINKNFLLYKDIINPYQPALSYFLALFSKFFGYGVPAFDTLTIILIVIIDISVYLVSLKLTSSRLAAFFSALFFILFSIPFQVNGLWFDLVQTPFILFSIFFFNKFLNHQKTRDLFFTVSLLTIAFFIKQQVLWLIIWFSIYLVIKNFRKSLKTLKENIFIFLIPLAVFAVIFVIFFLKGASNDYLFWTIAFPFIKASSLPGYILLPNKRQIFILLALSLIFIPYLLNKKEKVFIFGSYLSTLLFAYPRFDYFHLIPALSIISIITWLSFSISLRSKFLSALILVSLILLILFGLRSYKLNWTKETRFFEKYIYESATKMKNISGTDSHLIFIQNGPEQLYPLAGIVPSKPWGTQFPWYMELSNTQNEIINGLENQGVRFVLFRSYDQGQKFDLGVYRPEILSSYIENSYTPYKKLSSDLILKKINEN